MKLDVEQLRAFYVVTSRQSFTRAADEMHLSQSAVSKRILALEDAVGASLFDRIGHKVQLTSAGKILLPRAKAILEEIENSMQAIRNLGNEVSGSLNIATSHHIGLHRLPLILKTYTQQYPEVSLSIRFLDSEQACQGVLQGDPEIAIVTLPLEPAAQLSIVPVWKDHLDLVASKTHELANRKNLSLEQLVQHKAILPAQGTFTRTVLENALAAHKIKLISSMSTNYLETIKMMVSVGLGWSVLPRSMVDRDLCVLKTRDFSLTRMLGLVTHRSRTLSNAASALIDLVRSSEKL